MLTLHLNSAWWVGTLSVFNVQVVDGCGIVTTGFRYVFLHCSYATSILPTLRFEMHALKRFTPQLRSMPAAREGIWLTIASHTNDPTSRALSRMPLKSPISTTSLSNSTYPRKTSG